MANVTLRTKVSLLLIVPLVFITVSNGILLFLAGQPRLILASILILLGVLMAAKIFVQDSMLKILQKLSEFGNKCDTIEYSSKLLIHELNQTALKQDDLVSLKRELSELRAKIPELSELTISQDLKNLLILTLQEAEKAGANGKGHIVIAKEIARLCTEVNSTLLTVKGKMDEARRMTTELDEKFGNLQTKSDFYKTFLIAEGIEAQARRLYSSLPEFKEMKKETEVEGRAPFEIAVLRKAIRKKAA